MLYLYESGAKNPQILWFLSIIKLYDPVLQL